MRIKISIILLLLAAPCLAENSFEDPYVGFFNAKTLYDHCHQPTVSYRDGICDGYIAGIGDLVMETLPWAITSGAMECDKWRPGELKFGTLRQMVDWMFDTYPQASMPTSDAEMVVRQAIWQIFECHKPGDNKEAKEWS